jgi:enoyl-CoA hydratase
MTETAVTYELQDRVAVVTIDDGKANAISHDIAAGVHDALTRARDEAGAVVLAGRPGRFSAGFDLATMTSSDEAARHLLTAGAELGLEIFEYPKPVVIACTGHALAMGAILLFCSDIRIGAEGPFKIGLNEVAIGMPVPRFAVDLGRDRLTKAAFTRAINHATVYDPESALVAGFLDRVVPAEETVAAAVSEAAELAERLNPDGFATTRVNCRGDLADRVRHEMAADIATFTVDLPAP